MSPDAKRRRRENRSVERNLNLFHVEERLNRKTEFGISDPTPVEAIKNIRLELVQERRKYVGGT